MNVERFHTKHSLSHYGYKSKEDKKLNRRDFLHMSALTAEGAENA
jgi:hypothetical protein